MKSISKEVLTELSLLICGWCFNQALRFAPEDHPEGLIVVRAVRYWAARGLYDGGRCGCKEIDSFDCALSQGLTQMSCLCGCHKNRGF
jgi:hypothetical protein